MMTRNRNVERTTVRNENERRKEKESPGRIRRTNMLEGYLDAKERRDNEPIREHLNEAPG